MVTPPRTSGSSRRRAARAAVFNIPLHLASSSARGLSDLYFFLRHTATRDQLLIIDEPESHLDTQNQVLFARMLARFVTAGLRVLITTHSDYLVKELNNLIMLGREFPEREAVARKLGYKDAEGLDPQLVRGYVTEDGGLTECKIGTYGIEDAGLRRDYQPDQRCCHRAVVTRRGGDRRWSGYPSRSRYGTSCTDKARVRAKNGEVKLRERGVMDVVLAGIPADVKVINMRRLGSLSGIRPRARGKRRVTIY